MNVPCPHCAAGHAPEWRAATREWVHRRSTQAGRSTQFSITLCTARRVMPKKENAR